MKRYLTVNMKIYFDMDGVLSDFELGVAELCGLELRPQGKNSPEEDDRMFKAIHNVPHFYDKLKPLPGAAELFMEVWKRYGDDCQILTGIPKPWRGIVTAEVDKRNWVRRIISPDVIVNVVLRKDKVNFCTGPDCILVDDFIANIRAWEKAGGRGILHRSVEETRAQLCKIVKSI